MFRLPQQIGRHHLGVRRVVGDDQHFGRPRQQVDTHPPEQLALGLGDVGIAGSDDHVDGGDLVGPVGHGRERLRAAQQVDLVRPGEGHGRDRRRMRSAGHRRRAGGHTTHTGDLGGHDAHVRGSHQRITPARHVAGDAVHGDVLVAQTHARQRLDAQIADAGPLRLRETSDLFLRKANVLDDLRRDLSDDRIDGRLRQTEGVWVAIVERARVLAYRGVTTLLHGAEDLGHAPADVGGAPIDVGARLSLLQVSHHLISHLRWARSGERRRSCSSPLPFPALSAVIRRLTRPAPADERPPLA